MSTNTLVPLDSQFIQFTCDTVGCEQTDLSYITDSHESADGTSTVPSDSGEIVALCPQCVKEYRGVSS